MLLEGVFHGSGFAYFENCQNTLAANTAFKVHKIIGEQPNISFLKNNIKNKLLNESLEDSVLKALTEYTLSENQLTLFFQMNRTRRAISLAPNRILQPKIENMFPYLDMDVLQAALSVPFEHRLKHTLRRDLVKFAYPKLADIPYTQYKKQMSGYTINLRKEYLIEKRRQLRSNIWSYFIKSNKALDPFTVGPKLAVCLALTYCGKLRVPYEFGLTFQVFYEWLHENNINFSK
jgi:hypothetical protein